MTIIKSLKNPGRLYPIPADQIENLRHRVTVSHPDKIYKDKCIRLWLLLPFFLRL